MTMSYRIIRTATKLAQVLGYPKNDYILILHIFDVSKNI